MKLYKTATGIIVEENGSCYLLPQTNWDTLINRDDLFSFLQNSLLSLQPSGDEKWLQQQTLSAPIGTQEVWAAGVTYLKSKTARMEESKESGGATFYDKVYDAERPELFFKSTASRVVGSGQQVRIRKDSTWNVPEPELTLVITSSSRIVGYSIGNDMSSRSIEGENPLYLPQAKMYDGSAAVGPCILVTEHPISPLTEIAMLIERNGQNVFEGSTTIDRMKRTHTELVGFLFRESSYPVGCYLMTGTCVVPGNDFTLQSGDVVKISIEGIGTLVNTVE
ncbi:MAG: fumarylacetoacetate hydrolase family protein [Chitinophagaceae bacterium]|mgnify:CR=1 FL=1|nr:fumarylacetoacetate hydrolase family protein [Chitinophagaceae bacterium]